MDRESLFSITSDGTVDNTIITDKSGKVVGPVTEVNIQIKHGTPFITARVEVPSVELDLSQVLSRVDKHVLRLASTNDSSLPSKYIRQQVSQFMNEHNLRWSENDIGNGSALLEVLLIQFVEDCIKGLAEKEYEKETTSEDENE